MASDVNYIESLSYLISSYLQMINIDFPLPDLSHADSLTFISLTIRHLEYQNVIGVSLVPLKMIIKDAQTD